ncbi:MAG: hypothetical protein HOW73_47390 [Polyangiaceae bacterium]|nr:hypothetical protein [Polyangiaceae bacterium]
MATRVGVGRSTNRSSATAGSEAARQAIAPLEGRTPSLVLVFGTAGHDQTALLQGVRDVTGNAALSGCSGEGIITRYGSEETSHVVAVAAIASDEIVFETFFVGGFGDDSRACANALVDEIRKRGATGSLLLVFPDGISGNCSELVEVLDAALPPGTVVAGGTAGDLLSFERTWQYCDDRVESGGLAALMIGGAVRPEVVVSHGCDLIGAERVVTRAANGFVEEIDGEPAWSFFKAYLPDGADSLDALHVAHLLLAERIGGRDEGIDDFTVRVPVKLDKERGALFFPAGIREGTRVQLARRNAEKVCTRAVEAARRVGHGHGDAQPLLVLDLECAGRGSLLFAAETTSRLIKPIQGVFAQDVPWIGLHTYGEIAAVAGRTWFHNYTSIVCAFYHG